MSLDDGIKKEIDATCMHAINLADKYRQQNWELARELERLLLAQRKLTRTLESVDTMDEARARDILGHRVKEDNGLRFGDPFIDWCVGDKNIVIDGSLSLEEVEAAAWWMRTYGNKEK